MEEINYLKALVQGFVEFPDDVVVERTQDDMGVLLMLRVSESDTGRVIGKGGAMAMSLRSLLHAYGLTHNSRVSMKIHDPQRA